MIFESTPTGFIIAMDSRLHKTSQNESKQRRMVLSNQNKALCTWYIWGHPGGLGHPCNVLVLKNFKKLYVYLLTSHVMVNSSKNENSHEFLFSRCKMRGLKQGYTPLDPSGVSRGTLLSTHHFTT